MKWNELPTPCYVVDEGLIEENLKILKGIMERTGAKILLAQKAFSMYELYPLIGGYLSGATASGLYEARLGAEEMAGRASDSRKLENHVFSPAFREDEWDEITGHCDHVVFNSWKQISKYGESAKRAGMSIGLRVNPQCSTQEGHEIYDPCGKGSRLGITLDNFIKGIAGNCHGDQNNAKADSFANVVKGNDSENYRKETGEADLLKMLEGLHFHTLCEQNSDDLEQTLDAVEEKFGQWLPEMKWINFGGGHHITKKDYDIVRLEKCIRRMQDKYGLTVYLEPGEAVALNAGFLITTVLETLHNGVDIAILDTSAACHMPDVLEMPYRPPLQESGVSGEKAFTYLLGGPTCLAGDRIGEYSFDRALQEGDRLVFEDMAIYSMVKNNTFNGMALPAIVLRERDGNCRIVKEFGYEDFKNRI